MDLAGMLDAASPGALPAVVEIRFDPLWLSQGPLQLLLSWQGISAAAAVLVALLVAALAVSRYRPVRAADVPADAPSLRLDDLLFIAVAIVPGAVIGGRLVYGLDYPDVYGADLDRPVRPGAGVAVAARRRRRWHAQRRVHRADPERRPTGLAALARGRRATPPVPHRRRQVQPVPGRRRPGPAVVRAAGRGLPRPRPLAEHRAGHALGAVPAPRGASGSTFGVLVLAFVARRARFGTVFLWALAWWLGGRIVIAFTWRDQALIGPLAVEQVLAIGVLVVVGLLLGLGRLRSRHADTSADPDLAWPERPIDPTELPAPVTDRPG